MPGTSPTNRIIRWTSAAGLTLIMAGCMESPAADQAILETATVKTAATDAAAGAKAKQAELAAIYRPTPRPDRIILTWSDDPARSQAVTWRTDPSVRVGLAEIAVAGDNGQFVKRSRQLKAKTSALKTDLAIAHYHSVEFTALVPDTRYAYRVGDGTGWSEWFQFTTASTEPEPFSFIYFGDAQTEIKSLWSRVIREAATTVPRARFLVHAGDLVNNAARDAEWGEWFQAGGWLNAMIPSLPTPGNHEYSRQGMATTATLTEFWKPQFTLPENSLAELAESAYFLDFQGTRLISLNSNEKQAEQARWLELVLRDNPCRWTIITFHHPIYSATRQRDNAKLRALWQPVFDRYRVDLVLQGHDHTYARSGLVDGGGVVAGGTNEPVGVTGRSASSGTVYVVSVSGPKMYDLEKPYRPQFQRVAEDVQLFQVISIDGPELRYEARTATGIPYDGFTLRKRPGRPNELIEQVPRSPQRVRPPRPPAIPVPALPSL